MLFSAEWFAPKIWEYAFVNQAEWLSVRNKLRSEVGEAAWRSWLQSLCLANHTDTSVELGLPTRFMLNWVENHYGDRIRALVKAANPAIEKVQLLLFKEQPLAMTAGGEPIAAQQPPEPVAPTPPQAPIPQAAAANDDTKDLSQIQVRLDPRYTFDNFVVGKPNELAFAAARKVAENPNVSFNPLFLYGGVGLGKTHLMHAIAWHINKVSPQRQVMYLSAEKFMYEFIRAIRFKDTVAFKDMFRSVDVLMIDDVQFISGKDSTQEEFFHTFNALVDQNRQVILSADKSPSDLEGMEERLKSRLGWGLVADIHPANFELRLGILQSKSAQLDVKISDQVLEFLAQKINTNVRELEGALNRLAVSASISDADITIDYARTILKDLLRTSDRKVTIDDIQKAVCEHFNMRQNDMHSQRRARNVARPRQIAMYLCKQLTASSYPEIGRKFGGRDHTTVMHAIQTIERLSDEDQQLAEDVQLLQRYLCR